MVTFGYTIQSEYGLHARIAGLLVQQTKTMKCKVNIKKDNRIVDAKNLMELMSLRAKYGEFIEIEISGNEEETEAKEIKDFFEHYL